MRVATRESLTVSEAAESVGVSRDVIYEAIGRGELTHVVSSGTMYLRPARFAAWAQWRVARRYRGSVDPAGTRADRSAPGTHSSAV